MKTSIYQNEIVFLKKEQDVLLRKIQLQEDYINKQKTKVNLKDVNELQEMIMKFLRILSLQDAYHHFEQNETVKDENSFVTIVGKFYLLRFNKFLNELILVVTIKR